MRLHDYNENDAGNEKQITFIQHKKNQVKTKNKDMKCASVW